MGLSGYRQFYTAFGLSLLAGASLACASPSVSTPMASTAEQQQAEPTRNLSLPALPFAQQPMTIDSLSQRQGQSVIFQGDVRRQVPLVSGQLYQVQDNTGSIWVVTHGAAVDVAIGNAVTVQGTVQYKDIQISGSNLSEYYIEAERFQIDPASDD